MPKALHFTLLALCFVLPTVSLKVIAKGNEHSQLPQAVSNNAVAQVKINNKDYIISFPD